MKWSKDDNFYIHGLPYHEFAVVVRCKKCEFWRKGDCGWGTCSHIERVTASSWFCGDGERREE